MDLTDLAALDVWAKPKLGASMIHALSCLNLPAYVNKIFYESGWLGNHHLYLLIVAGYFLLLLLCMKNRTELILGHSKL